MSRIFEHCQNCLKFGVDKMAYNLIYAKFGNFQKLINILNDIRLIFTKRFCISKQAL